MPEILITPAAEDDLINIWVYIARDNPEAAGRTYSAAEETFKTLAAMPEIGTVYWTKRSKLKGLRFFPVKQFHNYVIYYREITDGVEIIRVLHTRMEKNRRLEPESGLAGRSLYTSDATRTPCSCRRKITP
jgi:toxin ParE1/3/4